MEILSPPDPIGVDVKEIKEDEGGYVLFSIKFAEPGL